jgi:hypothetical protein
VKRSGLEARDVKRVNAVVCIDARETTHSPQAHKVIGHNAQHPTPPLRSHACASSIPFLPDFCAAAHHSRSCSTLAARLLIPTHGAASSSLQCAIFPNPTCSTTGRRRGRPRAVRQASDWALPASHRPRAPLPVHGNKRVEGHSWPYQVKVAAARELRHSNVRCSDGILAGAAPGGRKAEGPCRARPLPSGALHQTPSPTPQFSRTSSTFKVIFLSLLESSPCLLSYPRRNVSTKLTGREPPAGKPGFRAQCD